jgi:hypothetical protein
MDGNSIIMDTSGFYKETEDGWFYAPNAVHAPEYTLERDGNRESVDGWQWHDKAPMDYLIYLTLQNENTGNNL